MKYFKQTHLNLCNDLSEHINKLKAELSSYKLYPKSKLNRYKKYFDITKHKKDNGFDYSVKMDRVEAMCEKQIKVDMDSKRIRTHIDETTDGKTFVTFIACVIRSYMLNKFSNIYLVSGQDGYRFAKALTKEQKEILSVFNASDEILRSIKGNMSTLKK